MNDRDAFYAPKGELDSEFVDDCVVWSAFAQSNYAVSLRDIAHKGRVYQIVQSVKGTSVGKEELAELRAAHDALREKLLPQITDYGFINHDVEYF